MFGPKYMMRIKITHVRLIRLLTFITGVLLQNYARYCHFRATRSGDSLVDVPAPNAMFILVQFLGGHISSALLSRSRPKLENSEDKPFPVLTFLFHFFTLEHVSTLFPSLLYKIIVKTDGWGWIRSWDPVHNFYVCTARQSIYDVGSSTILPMLQLKQRKLIFPIYPML